MSGFLRASPERWEFRAKMVQAFGALLVSVMIGLMTIFINFGNAKVSAAQTCRESLVELVTELSEANLKLGGDGSGAARTNRDDILRVVEVRFDTVNESCTQAGITIPRQVTEITANIGCSNPPPDSPGDKLRCLASLDSPPSPSPSLTPGDGGDRGTGSQSDVGTGGSPSPGRLYVQIGSESQRRQVGEALSGLTEEGVRIGRLRLAVVPGIDLASPVAADQLRCLKVTDCAIAQDVASALGEAIGIPPPTVVQLSERYEGDDSVAPGTFELWLAPGTLSDGQTVVHIQGD